MSDLVLLLKLKARHLRTALNFIIGGIIGSDLTDARVFERLYQVYCFIVAGACLALLWTALLNQTAEVFSVIGVGKTGELFQASLYIYVFVFVLTAIQNLRRCPVALSSPDISYIAASPIKPFSLVFSSLLPKVVGMGLLGFFVGYLLGVCLQNGLGLMIPSMCCAVLSMLTMIVSLLGGWVLGVFRLAGNTTPKYLVFVSIVLILIAIISPYFLLFGFFFVAGVNIQPVIVDGFPLLCTAALIVMVIEFALLRVGSSRIVMARVVDENALYSDMYSLRYMPLYDMAGYNDLRRRKLIASREPKVQLAIGPGQAALVSRSALSHLRQLRALPTLLFWGVFLAPTAIYLVFISSSPALWLFWATVLIALPSGAREMTRTFRDDTQNKMIRNSLPFSTFRILLCDVMPSFCVVSITSIIVIVTTQVANPSLPWFLIISLLINGVFVLCASLEGLRFFGTQRPMSYEIAAFICAFVLFLVSFVGSIALVSGALCVCLLVLSLVVRSCEE